jgi:antagonist of KipI
MGLRLRGPKLTFTGTELLSEGIPPGTVQVPSDGQPIILGAERQSTGGYPKPAVVITPDLGLAGQLKPGDKLGFNLVDHDAARRLTARFLRGLHGSRSH